MLSYQTNAGKTVRQVISIPALYLEVSTYQLPNQQQLSSSVSMHNQNWVKCVEIEAKLTPDDVDSWMETTVPTDAVLYPH